MVDKKKNYNEEFKNMQRIRHRVAAHNERQAKQNMKRLKEQKRDTHTHTPSTGNGEIISTIHILLSHDSWNDKGKKWQNIYTQSSKC